MRARRRVQVTQGLRDHAFGDRLSALLIACRRRKGGGTKNLCAHRFQRVMVEPSLSGWKFLLFLGRVEIYLQERDYVLCLLCPARGGLKMSCLAGKSHYDRQNKQQMDFQVAPLALLYSFLSFPAAALLLFLPALVLRIHTRTRTHNNTRSPLSPEPNLMKFRRRAHTFTYNTIHLSRTLTY